MIFDELSNPFLIVSIRPIGAEIEGGLVNNPPSRAWKIQRPSRARVNEAHRIPRGWNGPPRVLDFGTPSCPGAGRVWSRGVDGRRFAL